MGVSALVSTWADTGPAWIGAVGGVLGAVASILAIVIATRAATEHVSWVKVVTGSVGAGAVPSRFEIVNGSKQIVAIVSAVDDVTGDPIDALDKFIDFPAEIAPGMSFPIGVSRTFANSYPTVVDLTWTERRASQKRVSRRIRKVRLYL